ncbi:uncharacterized protein UHO2_07256 [Ustilago hordei]|uniref:Integrase catalytic domain-containing protein n=1 Tax=Ustilago hordei TaxID=120017 RepID=I2FUS4_USTHO|nr:uncharacterized protein UHO2_07256 [Ustilago hordei]CCF50667.1 uncharacterized protein UHOR_14558 [Ustilago hordei]SYW77414.1 uncharacterized protein UHO2_07256 [Ustilago hordei]
MIYKDCLLVPGLVTNLIGTKLVTHAQGKVTFEKEVITVQDKDRHAVGVPTSGDGYPAIAMMIWDDSMPEPTVSLTFTSRMVNATHSYRMCNKANLWHQQLGHASHDAIMWTCTVTLSHDIPLNAATEPETPCDICVHSKATAKNTAHPRRLGTPLELVSMDVMGPLHGNVKFVYILIIHDTFSGMIWVWGLTSKKEASQEATWWLSEMHITTHKELSEVIIDQGIKEVWVDQGKLWSKVFQDLCSSMGVKITASPTQHHTDNAFTEWAIQTIQKIMHSLLYDSRMDECWWPHAIAQAAFIHNRLAGSTHGNVTPYELFYTEHPELHHIWHFGCVAYDILRGSTHLTWL